jgi:hypothetical protein
VDALLARASIWREMGRCRRRTVSLRICAALRALVPRRLGSANGTIDARRIFFCTPIGRGKPEKTALDERVKGAAISACFADLGFLWDRRRSSRTALLDEER